MNFLNMFEDRVGRIFGDSSRGFLPPFSFKKLAKRATREMEDETYVIDGIDTAPALYTILVSPADDAVMRPLYAGLTVELEQFVEAQAKSRGYVFVGRPLVRFMVDPGMKGGRFSVFAENIDARTLARLRAEEEAFLESGLGMGGAAGQSGEQQALRVNQGERRTPPEQVEVPEVDALDVYAAPAGDSMGGLDVMPAASVDNLYDEAPAPEPLPVPAAPSDPDFDDGYGFAPVAAAPADDAPEADPPSEGVIVAGDLDERRERPVVAVPDLEDDYDDEDELAELDRLTEDAPLPVPTRPVQPATSLLIDRQSGRTYTVTAPSCIIGRERTRGGVLLRDPNVSRRHAEITHEEGVWRIADLNSTNGTLVNDVDIDACILRDGDLITLGLVNLEFRES